MLGVILALGCLTSFGGAKANNDLGQQAEVQHVLILNSHSVGVPWASIMHESIRDTLTVAGGQHIRLHIEHTGLAENRSPDYAEGLLQFLRQKYRDIPLTVIVTLDVAATRWMMDHGVEGFTSIPTIFSIDETDVLLQPKPRHVLGVVAEFDVYRNVEAALTLHPDTRHIAIVGGADAIGTAFGALLLGAVADHQRAHQVINLVGLPMADILSGVSTLPDSSIIFYLPTLVDGAGEYFIPRRILPRISQVANAPIYGLWDIHVGFGIVGGYVSDTRQIGQALGNAVLDVLSDTPFDEIRIQPRFSSFQYDWEQLQRWSINPALLPAGSLIVNREPTLWDQYTWQIAATATLLLILTLMVLGLFLQRTRLVRAQSALENTKDHLEFKVSERTASLNRANVDLMASRDRFQRLVEDLGSHAAVYSHGTDGVLDYVGRGVEGILGLKAEDCIGMPFPQLVDWDPVGLQSAEIALSQMLQSGGRVPPWEMPFQRPDGRWGCILISSHVVSDHDDRDVHFEGIALDITNLKLAEQRAGEAKRLLQAALENSPSGILIADAPSRHIRFANRAALEMLGGEAELIGADLVQYAQSWPVCHPDGELMTVDDMPLTRSIRNGEVVTAEEAMIQLDDEHRRWVSVSSAPIADGEGWISAGIVVFSDITQQKHEQRLLQRSAHHDALTSLPNRVLLADRLNQAMARVRRSGTRLALVFIDLDRFKPINDRYGHDVGDQLLIALAQRMRLALRDVDTLARLGGDEFVAVLSDLSEAHDAEALVERLLAAVSAPVTVDGLNLQVTGSMGVTFYPQALDLDADQLMRQADQAMYQAKIQGRNTWQAFDAQKDDDFRGR